MNLDYIHHLPDDFSDKSRVWIYQGSRLFTLGEALEVEQMLKEFTDSWHSHGVPVKGFATLFFGQFIVLMADEEATGVSGCSTDSSVRLVKNISEKFGIDLFERTNLAFVVKEKIEVLPMSQLQYAADNGFITGETLYFNNLVESKKELEENWIIPIRQSWLTRRIVLPSETT